MSESAGAGRKRSREEMQADKHAKLAARIKPADEEEERLASLLFGGAAASVSAPHLPAGKSRKATAEPQPKRQRTEGGAAAWADSAEGSGSDDDEGGSRSGQPASRAVAAAWHDEDDERLEVNIAAVSRLRKLREEEGESKIGGGEYAKRLRALHAKRSGGDGGESGETPAWARSDAPAPGAKGAKGSKADVDSDFSEEDLSGEEEDEDDEAVLRQAGGLTQRSALLAPNKLSVTRMRDANRAEPSKAVIQGVGWHPAGNILFTAGLDQKLRFFSIDGKKNPKVSSVHFPDLPIASAEWVCGGAEVVVSGRRPFFYSYDVEAGKAHRIPRILGRDEKSLETFVASPAGAGHACALLAFAGKDGHVILTSARTKQWANTLKMNGQVRGLAFTRPAPATGGATPGPVVDGHDHWYDLLALGSDGCVTRWDLRTMKCLGRHQDQGSAAGTALAATPDGTRYAVGSTSGIVNEYDAGAVSEAWAGTGSSTARGGFGGGGGSLASATRSIFAAAGGGFGGSSGGAGGAASDHTATFAPVHTYSNLTTRISSLAYSHDGAMLSVATQATMDGYRVAHTASGTVFANWPTGATPLHYVTSHAFSPHSGYLAIGNDRGRVLLYRLNHYTDA